MASYDFNNLTCLVFLAHDHCIRVQVSGAPGGKLSLMFHPRSVREGGMSERHPTLETAVENWRKQRAKDREFVPETVATE